MIFESKGIVFRNQKYKESSVILDVYTEKHGLLTFIINGVRKAKSKIAPSAVQLMSLIEINAYYKEERSLQKIKDIRTDLIYKSLPFEVIKASVGTFMVEVARKCVKEQAPNPELFEFLYKSFAGLDALEAGLSIYHLNYLVDLAHYLGILPFFDPEDVKGLYFDMLEGDFYDRPMAHGQYMKPEEANLFLRGLTGIKERDMNVEERRLFIRLMLRYYSIHIPNMGQINSHEILETVLS